jgi:hypothetical protein
LHNDSLAGNWDELTSRLDRNGALDRWALDEPALLGVDRVQDMARLTARGADPARADELIGALVRLAAANGGCDDDALLLVLHLLSDIVVPMAAELADLSHDVLPVIVSELACQIRARDARRPTRGWATALKWVTRRAVLAEFRPTLRDRPDVRETALDPAHPAWAGPRVGGAEPVPQPGGDEDLDLVDVLLWAVRAGVDRADLALLAATESARAGGQRRSDEAVAAAFGVSVRTLYRRNNRTVTALRHCGADYLSAVA